MAADPAAAILDVREPGELQKMGSVPGAINLPISTLRQRMGEVPSGRALYVYCAVGLRGYLACRQLAQAGHDATNVAGGFRSYKDFVGAGLRAHAPPRL